MSTNIDLAKLEARRRELQEQLEAATSFDEQSYVQKEIDRLDRLINFVKDCT